MMVGSTAIFATAVKGLRSSGDENFFSERARGWVKRHPHVLVSGVVLTRIVAEKAVNNASEMFTSGAADPLPEDDKRIATDINDRAGRGFSAYEDFQSADGHFVKTKKVFNALQMAVNGRKVARGFGNLGR
jgi:hypothetical protein